MGEEHDEDNDDHVDQDEDDSSSNEHPNFRSQLSTLPFVVGRPQLRTWQFFHLELDLDRKVTV